MFQDFETIREQLEKFAPVINAYKSEAVQLRIVELVLSRKSIEVPPIIPAIVPEEPVENKNPDVTIVTTRKVRKVTAKKTGRPGPGAMVDTLVAEGFFKAPIGVAEVVKHCRDSRVLVYSNTEIAVALSRAVKRGKLKREKTTDDQFTYSAA